MVSQHLDGFEAVGCSRQDWQWDGGIACSVPVRRLNFWSNVDQGNVTLQGPGYSVQPNGASPVLGLNAGLMQYEPMHGGYGLPVLAGANYTVAGDWRGDVVVEFSDARIADYFGEGAESLGLTVMNGTSCSMTSHDPREYLDPLGLNGQSAGVQLEEKLS